MRPQKDIIARITPPTTEALSSSRSPLPNLSDDLLRGAGEIAGFVYGSPEHKRKIYHLANDANVRLPIFRMGAVICARKSTLLAWIAEQESGPCARSSLPGKC